MLAQIFLILSAVVLATFQNPVQTINYVNNVGDDNYHFEYKTSDGTDRSEQGRFENGVWTVTGFFSWIGENGNTYITRFVADDKGYRLLYEPPQQANIGFAVGSGSAASLLGIGK